MTTTNSCYKNKPSWKGAPPAGPEPGLRHESFWKDMTPSEQELTEVALLQALAIHVKHEAVRGVSKHQVVPLDRALNSRYVVANKK